MEFDQDFNKEDLLNCIKVVGDDVSDVGIDELLYLLAEYIKDEDIFNEIDKYVETYINPMFEQSKRKVNC